MRVRRSTKIIAAISLAFGVMLSALALSAAFDHNPQYRFYGPEPHDLHWDQILPVGISWLLMGLPLFLLLCVSSRPPKP